MSAHSARMAAPARVAGRQTRRRAAMVTRAGLFLWVPLWMSLGIGLWFLTPGLWNGPALIALCLAILAAAGLMLAAPRLAETGRMGWDMADLLRLIAAASALTMLGTGLITLRSVMVAAPVMEWRYYGPVEGRLTDIDRSSRDRIRLTLDQVVLHNTAPERVPRRVRLSLMDPQAQAALPALGQRIMMTGHLGPPPGPAAPGSFDFRQHAWFMGLGAVGYTRSPVLAVTAPEGGIWLMHRARMSISAAIQDAIGGQAGAVASALMTGDRSGISEATNEIMRASNLYHIISISGLHMGMLAGFVYNAMRLALVLAEGLGLRGPMAMHKLAAATAMAAAAIYLWLSGGGVATERSFIMVAVMLGAILADRRAISLRTLTFAGVVILIYSPESILSPGFQMSFAATAALILSYGPWLAVAPRIPWWLRPVVMLLVSSFVAGMATAPIAAAHFNRMAQYGMIANLLAVPVMGTLVMPAGVIAALLGPLGLAAPALWVMGIGTKWMLLVAEIVAGLAGAVMAVPLPPWPLLPLMCFGAMLTILCWRRGPVAQQPVVIRAGLVLGFVLLISAATSWTTMRRPALLIAPEGEAVGLMTPQGRAMSKPAGGSFIASSWLLEDGDIASQAEAAARPAWQGDRRDRWADWPDSGLTIWHFTGKGSGLRALDACRQGRIVVASESVPRDRRGQIGDCLFFDPARLRQSGALAIDATAAGGLRITAVSDYVGPAPWTGRGAR